MTYDIKQDHKLIRKVNYVEALLKRVKGLTTKGWTSALYAKAIEREIVSALASSEVNYLTDYEISKALTLNDIAQVKKKLVLQSPRAQARANYKLKLDLEGAKVAAKRLKHTRR